MRSTAGAHELGFVGEGTLLASSPRMTQSEVELRSRSASEKRGETLPSKLVEPPPPARASMPSYDDLEPYNLPFTD